MPIPRIAIAAIFCSAVLLAHDPTLHRTKTITGEVVAIQEDGFDLRTRTGVLKVKFSGKTKFADNKKPAQRASLHEGGWVGVVGNEQHNHDFLAVEVVLGLPAPPSSTKR